MRRDQNEEKKIELPSAVDDAASVILESKRKEAFVRKNAPVDKKSSERDQAVFVIAVLVFVAFSAILIYLL